MRRSGISTRLKVDGAITKILFVRNAEAQLPFVTLSTEGRFMFTEKNKGKMADAIWVVLVLVAAVLAISLIGHGAAFGL